MEGLFYMATHGVEDVLGRVSGMSPEELIDLMEEYLEEDER